MSVENKTLNSDGMEDRAVSRIRAAVEASLPASRLPPNVHESPEAWDRWWIDYHRKTFEQQQAASMLRQHSLKAGSTAFTMSDTSLWELQESATHLRQDISGFLEIALRENLLPEIVDTWNSFSHKERMLFVVAGSQAAEQTIVSMSGRMVAPDISFDYLVCKGGFLELLDWLVESDVRFPAGKGFIERFCPVYDVITGISRDSSNSLDRASRTRLFDSERGNITRHRFFCYLVVTISDLMLLNTPRHRQFFGDFDRPRWVLARPFLPGIKSELRPEDPHPGTSRPTSRTSRREIPEWIGTNKTFTYCSKCIKLENPQRKLPYCSAECQKAHWPLHKPFCGKHYVDVLPTPTFLPSICPNPPSSIARWQLLTMSSSFPAVFHLHSITSTGTSITPLVLVRPDGIDDDTFRRRWEFVQSIWKRAVERTEEQRQAAEAKNGGRNEDANLVGWLTMVALHGTEKEGGLNEARQQAVLRQVMFDFRLGYSVVMMELARVLQLYDVSKFKPRSGGFFKMS